MATERVDREQYVLDVLAKDGSLSVSRLAKDLGVSEVTVRATLRNLEGRGLLSRTWGGARPTSIRTVLERAPHHSAEKERIAAAAAELIVDFDTVFIEAGTTTAQVVRSLAGRTGVQIVTNSTLVFAYARALGTLEVILTGGSFHRESESLVGPLAVRGIGEFNTRLAFVGTDGLTPGRGTTTQFAEGAEVIRAMHAHAQETWLLADSSKFGETGFVNVLPLTDLAGIVTDTDLPPEVRTELDRTGLRVLSV
jgi:DeoR family galactitol utilization operon repressor